MHTEAQLFLSSRFSVPDTVLMDGRNDYADEPS